jgi:hypothetical protein
MKQQGSRLILRRYDMNGRFQMQGGKNWILPKEINANRFFWDSHWLESWSNHFCPSMGPMEGAWLWTLVNQVGLKVNLEKISIIILSKRFIWTWEEG